VNVLASVVAAVNNAALCSLALGFAASENGMAAGGDAVGWVGVTVPDGGNVEAGGCGANVPEPGA